MPDCHPTPESTPQANGVRLAPDSWPSFSVSETIAPLRVMVVAYDGKPLGMGYAVSRHTLRGHVTGYVVEYDAGFREHVAYSQLRNPDNIIAPPLYIWLRRRFTGTSPAGDAA